MARGQGLKDVLIGYRCTSGSSYFEVYASFTMSGLLTRSYMESYTDGTYRYSFTVFVDSNNNIYMPYYDGNYFDMYEELVGVGKCFWFE